MENRLAIVTGSGRGIGQAIALKFASLGIDIAIVDIDEQGGNETKAKIEGLGRSAEVYQVDLTQREDVFSTVEKICEKWGRLDILVNNAGWTPNQYFIDNDPDDWEKIVGINYLAVLYVTRATLKYMIKQNQGKIVNISSDAARVGVPKEAVYSGAKSAVVGFSKSLAVEVAKYNINVNVVSPSTTDTPLVRNILTPEQLERRNKSIPLGRIAKPEDIANAVAFFVSPESEYITGQVLSVNGGSTRIG